MSNGNASVLTSEDVEQMKQDIVLMVANATIDRRINLGDLATDPRRNLNDECGYPETRELTPQLFKDQYDRNPVAARTVEVFPKESWKIQPTVLEDESPEVSTEFEKAFNDLSKDLMEESWYQDEEGNPIWEQLVRIDVLSGIGSFGALLIGIDDGLELREPVQPGEGKQLIYLRSFDESLVDIQSYEQDKTNRRYGMPNMYNITLNDPKETQRGGIGYDTSTESVHWSRVVHIADNLGSSEIFGSPRMQPVINRLLDLDKLYGGSAEMYYKGAFPGYLFSSDPALKGDVNWNISTIRNQIEQYFNGLQRYAAVKGMQADSLAPQVVDPTPQIDTQIEAICIRLGIPKRIFMGSERGNLASTQDSDAWNDRLKYRQTNYITPRIIVPFVNRLIGIGVLPAPKGYSVQWPDLATMTGAEKADVAVKRTRAMADYVGGNVEAIMSPFDFYTRILSFTKDETAVIVEDAVQGANDRMTEPEIVETEGRDGEGLPGKEESKTEQESISNVYESLKNRVIVDSNDALTVSSFISAEPVENNHAVSDIETEKIDSRPKLRNFTVDNALITETVAEMPASSESISEKDLENIVDKLVNK